MTGFAFWKPAAILISGILAMPGAAAAQNIQLRGVVNDPSGAVVRHAEVILIAASGKTYSGYTTVRGEFALSRIPPGVYTLTIQAPGFAAYTRPGVVIQAQPSPPLAVRLAIESERQTVNVHPPSRTRLRLAPAHNAGALVVQGKALRMLSNDPDELLSQLQELAGPAVGPNGATIYIDGFSGGDLPPKSAILAVRVNRNPFSPEHAHLGYGRIEILTKPGRQQWHGGAAVYGNASAWNSRSPFLAGTSQPPYHTLLYNARLGGPLGRKTSFFFAAQRRDINRDSLTHTEILDPATLTPELYTAAIANPRTLTNASLRIDHQLSASNTLMARYNYFGAVEANDGIGGQALPSQGYDFTRRHHLFQLADTQILGPNGLNQLRVQVLHFHNTQLPAALAPTLDVIGAFTGGGFTGGRDLRSESHYQFENLTSYTLGDHQIEFGESVRKIVRGEANYNNFNGAFTFNSLADYQRTEQDLKSGMTMAQIQAAGAGPSQFNLTAGNPHAQITRLDGAFYAGDDWKIEPSLEFSYGLRFETENVLADHADWAPRVGVAWGFNSKTILRAGWGVFYDRLDDSQMYQAARLNGRNQLAYIVPNPGFFPNFPAPSALAAQYAAAPAIYTVAPNLQAPYTMTAAASLERQVRRNLTVSLTYLNSRGNRQFLSNDANAPLPGTFNPAVPGSGVRPYGNAAGNIYEYQSRGIFRQNQFIANFNWRGGAASLFGYYMYNRAFSDTAGVNRFAANPYNLLADYGVASFGVRDRLFLGGNFALPWGVQLFPMILARSGIPFSITLGQDLYGTGNHNARPAPATAGTPAADLRVTPYGNFNIAPSPTGAIIPPNTATGPAAWVFNLRASKTFGLGPVTGGRRGGAGIGGGRHHDHDHGHHGGLGPGGLSSGGLGIHGAGGSERRYALTVSIAVRNLFNHVNLGSPVGNLNSPLFGQSVALAGDPYASGGTALRRIDLGLALNF